MLDPVVERLIEQMLNDEITAEDAAKISGLPLLEFAEKAKACLRSRLGELNDMTERVKQDLKKKVEEFGG